MPHKVIIPQKAFETEIVEIIWTLKDGSLFYQRIKIPPKSVREARNAVSNRREDAEETGQ